MLDLDFIRNNRDIVFAAVKNKNLQDKIDVDEFLKIDKKRRVLIAHVEGLKQERNLITAKISNTTEQEKEILIKTASKLKEDITEIEEEGKEIEEKFQTMYLAFPNITSDLMPVGASEDENVIVETWGSIPKFDFEIKDHVQIGKDLNLIDIEKSAEVSGSRFYYLKNEAVLIQFAILQFVFDTLTNQQTLQQIIDKNKLSVSNKPFTPILPPIIMKQEVMKKMDRLDPLDERYTLDKDEQVLVGSAEHTVGSYHIGEVIPETSLPLRYIAYSTAFRREAGSYGRDMKGILRVHHFDKAEMETFTTKENGQAEQDFIVAIQKYLVEQLEIPYQLMQICTGDTGKPDFNQFDINCWIPSQNQYRETHTSDYVTDFQARRLQTKVERLDGTKEFVHMNDATAFAMTRMIIAILENNQTKDGKVRIPQVLQKYVGKEFIG